MKLTVPANYDLDLVSELAEHPVDEVYGKFATDVVGGGRPSYMGTPLSQADLRQYVDSLSRRGIAFNYLLNASCLGNREWSRRFQRRLDRLLGQLAEMGVARITVSTPFLLDAIKRRFPNFKVKVGIYAQVDTPRRARFWQDHGADAITLESFSINRNFARLEAIRAAVSCELVLIANHPCLPNCPLQPYHQNGIAHASDGSGRLFIDYCFLRCSRMRMEDTSLLIKAQWIRPEDTSRYEAMGYRTFKLLERDMPSNELLARVEAYSLRWFDGNLADLMLPYGFRSAPRRSWLWAVKHFCRPWQVAPRKALALLALARKQGMLFAQDKRPIVVDSREIPHDFLSGFASRDCATDDCPTCGYCDALAKRAVTVDEEFRRQSLEQYRQVEDQLASGELWR